MNYALTGEMSQNCGYRIADCGMRIEELKVSGFRCQVSAKKQTTSSPGLRPGQAGQVGHGAWRNTAGR